MCTWLIAVSQTDSWSLFTSTNSVWSSRLTTALGLYSTKKPWRSDWSSEPRNTTLTSHADLELTGKIHVIYRWLTGILGLLVSLELSHDMIGAINLQKLLFLFMIRSFQLCWRDLGVVPPLQLSHSVVQFKPMTADDYSTAAHQPPSAATPRPRLFWFALQKDWDISIPPAAECLLPRQVKDTCLQVTKWHKEHITVSEDAEKDTEFFPCFYVSIYRVSYEEKLVCYKFGLI